MFICHKCCADTNRCTGSLMGGSHGPCESCGEVAGCCDCHLTPTWTEHAKGDCNGKDSSTDGN
jgi:hypothetical protein